MNIALIQNENLPTNNNIMKTTSLYKSRNEDKTNYLHGRKPLRIRFYANGDKFFQGKKISLYSHRYRDLEELMAELTSKMPAQVYLPSGIRQLFSPSSGRRITEINQLENDHDYVCAGNETFKGVNYGRHEREPWFRGRPQNLARFAQLLPLGLGVSNVNSTTPSGSYQNNNSYHSSSRPLADQSHYYNFNSTYAKQNAFPTRYHKPVLGGGIGVGGVVASTGYLNQTRSQLPSSVMYPKLIKIRNKQIPPGRTGVNYFSNVNNTHSNSYYQEMLNQQVKPRVITVVRNSNEKPKNFVRILLNKRSVQSFEALIDDIETSLKDQTQNKATSNGSKISKIFNLLGKEIKSIADFFRNDEFFIAVGEQETFGERQVKEILDDMYPNHPQTSQIMHYWVSRRPEEQNSPAVLYKETANNVTTDTGSTNISVDKRDSGFEEQDFSSKDSGEYSLQNDPATLPRPKISTNKPVISKRQKRTEPRTSDTVTRRNRKPVTNDVENSPAHLPEPNVNQRSTQQKNADRLKAAHLEREKYRQRVKEELNSERKQVNSIQDQSDTYSQMIKKSVADKGSIDVFKRIDDERREERKQNMRNKQDRKVTQSSASVSASSSSLSTVTGATEQLPILDVEINNNKIIVDNSVESTNVDENKENNFNHTLPPPTTSASPLILTPYDASPKVIRKLNKISEVTNEDEDMINQTSRRHLDKDIVISSEIKIDEEEVEVEEEEEEKEDKELSETNKIEDSKDTVNEKKFDIEMPPIEPFDESKISLRGGDKEHIPSANKKSVQNNETKVNESKLEITKSETEEVKSRTPIERHEFNQTKPLPTTPNHKSDISVNSGIKSSNKTIHLSTTEATEIVTQNLPGHRVMGKLCRQLTSSDAVYERYETSRLLGDGNFAVVKLAVRKDHRRHEYALKIIDKSKMRGKETMIENEIWIMKLCHHNNIIRLKEEYETLKEVFLVMELIKGGDLFDAITQSVKFGETVAANMVIDMTNALFYLHSRRIVHRDLKPENLLVLRHKDGSMTLKLADFGLAMEVKKLIYTVCGTPTYVAPEILAEKGYSLEVDMWALGVITYILLCGFPPFRSPNRDQEQLFEMIKSGNFNFISPYWDNISYEVKDLIRKLLVVDRKSRYTTVDVLSHRWIMTVGGSLSLGDTERRQKVVELEEESQKNIEQFQSQKKELRSQINKEIQQAYLNSNKK